MAPAAFALAEVARVLRDGGVVGTVSRNPQCAQQVVLPQVCYPIEFFENLYEQLGLQIVRCYGSLAREPFDRTQSPLIFIYAKKVEQARAPTFPTTFDLYQGKAAEYDQLVATSDYAIPSWLKPSLAMVRGQAGTNLDLCKKIQIGEGSYFDRSFFCSASEFVSNLPDLIASLSPTLVRGGLHLAEQG